jgi:hypothetical protein
VEITKQKDKKFHVLGELAVAPYTILNNVLRELKRAIAACGNRLVLVMEVLPRFLLRPCCDDTGHCSNTRLLDAAGIAAGKRILHDLADLNMKIADFLSASNVRYISTGDLLAGSDNASMGDLMDALYTSWSKDSVHGDKSAYNRIAVGLLNILSRKVPYGDLRNHLNPRKRGRDDSPAASGPGRSRSSPPAAGEAPTTQPTDPHPALATAVPSARLAGGGATAVITKAVIPAFAGLAFARVADRVTRHLRCV